MADYRFVTTWELVAPLEAVWTEVGDPTNWPSFWVGLEQVNVIAPGDSEGRDGVYELVFKSFLPYRLRLTARVTEKRPPRHLRMETEGELQGTATFDLAGKEDRTTSTLVWETRTTLAWMNVIAPVMRGLFEWNHDVLMRKAGEGLARRIGATVTHKEGSAPPLARALLPPLTAIVALGWGARRLWRSTRE